MIGPITMTKRLAWLILIATVPLLSCTPARPAQELTQGAQLTQFSVIGALMVGRYDGVATLAEVLRAGDFGLGTLDQLDGELIILDGQAYQVPAEGDVRTVGDERTTPFAVVLPFAPTATIPCPAAESLVALESALDQTIENRNRFAAIRLDGLARSITVRSVPKQVDGPGKPLGEAARSQTVWTRKNVVGTFVGVRSPRWAGGVTVPGYHWHFLSRDLSFGGHVLDCDLDEGIARYQVVSNWVVKLDPSEGFDHANLDQDFSHDLKRVESTRGSDQSAQPR